MSNIKRSLNLLLPDFDPEEALSVESISLPFPNVPPLDNISQCRRLLPEGAADAIQTERHLKPGSKHANAPKLPATSSADAVGVETAASSSSSQPEQKTDKGSLAHQWAHSFDDGPLNLLKRLANTRINRGRQVRVVVRRQFGVRSICQGELQLFDRHLNLVLLHATESAVVQPQGPRPAPGGRWPRAQWERRAIGQLLVRGDCVVSISAPLRQPQPEAAVTAFRRLAARAARRM
eukprot:4533777-Prymnesium_polylepis.1